jgi:predicted nucleic acid-binding protein
LDERKGHQVARILYSLKVAGTSRRLIDAQKAGIISNLNNTIQVLGNSGYWILDKLVKVAIQESGENR